MVALWSPPACLSHPLACLRARSREIRRQTGERLIFPLTPLSLRRDNLLTAMPGDGDTGSGTDGGCWSGRMEGHRKNGTQGGCILTFPSRDSLSLPLFLLHPCSVSPRQQHFFLRRTCPCDPCLSGRDPRCHAMPHAAYLLGEQRALKERNHK